jgi:Tol biopolymer transport system component
MSNRANTATMRRILRVLTVTSTCVLILSAVLPLCAQPPAPASPPALGGKIAFVSNGMKRNSDSGDGGYDIYVMNDDGSNRTRLTNDPAMEDNPCFSSDGSKIAFTSNRSGKYDIYVMKPDGSEVNRLTDDPSDDIHPSFSPDGSKIAFSSNRNGNYSLYVMSADGSNQTRLTYNPPDKTKHGIPLSGDYCAVWSPDGSKIAFSSIDNTINSDPMEHTNIYVVNVDGSNVTRLTNSTGVVTDGFPSWSPDGSKIIFNHSPGGFPDKKGDIYMMNADGSNQIRVTSTVESEMMPAFSPDGRKIAFVSVPASMADNQFEALPDRWEIFVMNADGSGRTRLTNNTTTDLRPSWGPAISTTTAPEPSSESSL